MKPTRLGFRPKRVGGMRKRKARADHPVIVSKASTFFRVVVDEIELRLPNRAGRLASFSIHIDFQSGSFI
jgi:hypothetical protein